MEQQNDEDRFYWLETLLSPTINRLGRVFSAMPAVVVQFLERNPASGVVRTA
jgi:hypothetical protein